MIPIMIALKFTGEHYIFYMQPRIGKNEKEFHALKFATMLKDSPNMTGGELTQKDDPRILPMGKFLRKTKINELPQLVNIFVGQMSFVGPRPQVKKHYDLYLPEVKSLIRKVSPGISGLGSVVFRDEETILDKITGDRDLFYATIIAPYKGKLEVWFVQHHTLLNYFKLILMTIDAVINPASQKWKVMFKDLPPIPGELKPYFESFTKHG